MTNGRAGMSVSGAVPLAADEPLAVSSKADDARRALLERAAGAAGTAWAGEQIVALRTERRRIVGGWPGTMGEARVRSRSSLASTLTGPARAARPYTAEELEIAARATYASARSAWNANAEREGSDVSDSDVTDTEDA